MQLITLFVLFSPLIKKVHLAGIIIETPKVDTSEHVEAAVNILSCYTDQIRTVGLAGVSTEAISKMLVLRGFLNPVILIGDTSRIVRKEPLNPLFDYKLHVFIVTVTNSTTLAQSLSQISSSVWWNHMASFLFLDWSMSKNGCSNAKEILLEASKNNVIHSKFMCLYRPTEKLIYTYNPYTNRAPKPWQLVNTYKVKYYDKWTLFVQVYRDEKKICDELDFDKTADLNGYKINARIPWMKNNSFPILLERHHNIFIQSLQTALNATFCHRDTVFDITFTFETLDLRIEDPTTYPFLASSLFIMTQYRGHMSQLQKIASVLDVCSRIGLFLVCLITLLFFKCYLRSPLISTIMYLILIICNGPLPNIPRKLVPRIYLGSLFLLVLTIQGIYQGKFASLLTKEELLPNVNAFQDLARFNYTIHSNTWLRFRFSVPAFQGRWIEHPSESCGIFILNDSKDACIGEKIFLMNEAAKFKLHLSHDSISNIYAAYEIRSNWPLEERVNTILQRCFEGSFTDFVFAGKLSRLEYTLHTYENGDNDNECEVLTLEELRFAFDILGVCLGCATICFIVEIMISHSYRDIEKLRGYIRR